VNPLPPIAAGIVGVEAGPLAHAIDARWLMAYAAALGETDPRYFDTEAAGAPVAHPLFPVCYEWPLALAVRAKAIDRSIDARSVHAAHRLVIHRAPRAGDVLTTMARVVAVERRRAGTLVAVRFTTLDAAGRPVTTTDYDSVYRGVDLIGNDRGAAEPGGTGGGGGPVREPLRSPAPDSPEIRWTEAVDVAATAAHVYTECARIWNPIHTDIAVARAAGLPGPILHGTATLALAVSRVIALDLGGDPARVHGVSVRFTGMVPLPSRFTVRGGPLDREAVAFDAIDADGRPVLSDGALGL